MHASDPIASKNTAHASSIARPAQKPVPVNSARIFMTKMTTNKKGSEKKGMRELEMMRMMIKWRMGMKVRSGGF